MVAHSLGRLQQGLSERLGGESARQRNRAPEPAEDFLSGESGTVGGLDGLRRAALDELVDAAALLSGAQWRLARAARREPPRRRILVLGIQRPQWRALSQAVGRELTRSRHEVHMRLSPPGEQGKFENLNRLLAEHPTDGYDWLLVLDDDIELPRGFLDRFLFLIERFGLDLAQPAHVACSHAAWQVTRRRTGSVVRESAFVEIGPLTALSRRTFGTLLPFPELRMGWGLDAHWAALARRQGWRCGITDAVAIRHRAAPAAQAYSRRGALQEAREFLRERPYLPADELQRTLMTHRHW